MSEILRGIKAGILAMLIVRIIGSVISIIGFMIYIPQDHQASTFPSFVLSLFMSVIFGVLIFGTLFGFFYALLYTKLPSNEPTTKGMALAILYFIFAKLLNYTIIYIAQPHINLVEYFIVTVLNLSLFIDIILGIVLLGFLVGKFWGTAPLKEEIGMSTGVGPEWYRETR